jgi:hypothetical protein
MKIKLDETPTKCSHILLEINGKKIVTIKENLMGSEIIDMSNSKDTIAVNDVRREIVTMNTTDWAEIKQNIEKKEFALNAF